MKCRVAIPAAVLAAGYLCICARSQDAAAGPERPTHTGYIRFGVPPVQESRQLWSRWFALIDEVNARCGGCRLRLESALSEATYDKKVRTGDLDVVLVEPHRVLPYERMGYRVFARVATEDRIGGVVVIRADAGLKTPRSLAGAKVAFSSPDALASTMLVRNWFREETGRDLARQCTVVYLGSESSVLKAVAVGDVTAAGVSRAAWDGFRERYPHWAEILTARWYTETLSGPALMAHTRLARDQVEALRAALLTLPNTPAGREAIDRTGYHGFRTAAGASYDDVWEFVQHYSRVFRGAAARGPA